eukprot:TRINITY_DN33233_c0_g1_i1.p2 TRINITY_DN33233_c0_g1~~TRINITY_DN33233_c0_g1_i1.p2  ORF type:complete len:426 (-),score=88.18 TRINITY_DN33233_c0_g1_i1:44-1321(-)
MAGEYRVALCIGLFLLVVWEGRADEETALGWLNAVHLPSCGPTKSLHACDMCKNIAMSIINKGICTHDGMEEEKKQLLVRFSRDVHSPSIHKEMNHIFNVLCKQDFSMAFHNWNKFDLNIKQKLSDNQLVEACCSSRSCVGRATPFCFNTYDIPEVDDCAGEVPREQILRRVNKFGTYKEKMESLFKEFREYGKRCKWNYGGGDCYDERDDLLEARSNGVQCGPLASALRTMAVAQPPRGLGIPKHLVQEVLYNYTFITNTGKHIRAKAVPYADWGFRGNVLREGQDGQFQFTGKSLFLRHYVLLAFGDLWDAALGMRVENIYDAILPPKELPHKFEEIYVDSLCHKDHNKKNPKNHCRALEDGHKTTLSDVFKTSVAEWNLPYGLEFAPKLFPGYTFRGCTYNKREEALRCNGWYMWHILDEGC